jgi:mannose/fructose/N-acetylgalactosamine-specific phosphotransferase system component IIC
LEKKFEFFEKEKIVMNVIILSLIGAIIMLDKYAFGEFGFSQPIISGTIIGAIFGDIYSGIFLGAMIQLIFLGESPFGGDITPDGQAAGIVGTVSYFLMRSSNLIEQTLFLAIIFALVGALIGGALEIYARRYNEKIYHTFERRENLLYLCHFIGLVTAFLRGFFLLLPFFIVANIIIIPGSFPMLTKELLMIIGISLGLANGIYLFIKRATMIYVGFGVLCGLILFVL